METEYAVYLGQEQKNGFTGFLSENNFFFVVEIFDGYTQEQGEMLMASLSAISSLEHLTLASFDSTISDILKHANVPLDTSVAAGYIRGNVMYLKTTGTGEVYLQRKRYFEKLLTGANIASGAYQTNDVFIFTTTFFTESLRGIEKLKSQLHKNPPLEQLVEDLKGSFESQDDSGAIGLLVRMNSKEKQTESKPKTFVFEKVKAKLHTFFSDFPKKGILKKSIVICGVAVCLSLLGWNVISRIHEQGGVSLSGVKSFDEQKQAVEAKIETAKSQKDTTQDGLKTVADARLLLDDMRKNTAKDKQKTVEDLSKQITDIESIILKREYKTGSEFYDFSLEEEGAKGTRIYLFEEMLSVLNPDGKVYQLSLDKKSLAKRKLPSGVSSSSLVAAYENTIYIFDPLQGIVKLDENDGVKKMISKDDSWGSISDMNVFNGNIYILDGGAGNIYKYAVTEGGFGDKTSYFKGSYDPIDSESSFAIDSSVYVSNSNSITKYTAGLKADFNMQLPDSSFSITKVLAYKDGEQLYVWDKKNGVVYVLTKDGAYTKQVVSDIFSKGSDMEVYKDKAYLISGSKLYEVAL